MGNPFDAEFWRERARAARAVQDMAEADKAINEAARLAPDDPLTTFLRAQSAYELGHPAAALFARAVQLWPENPDALRNHALALASEGLPEEAIRLLARALAARPDWLDGQRVLASLRYSHGETEGYDADFAEAVKAQPQNQGLWLGWFTLRAQQRDWPAARRILDEATVHLGETRALAIARAFEGQGLRMMGLLTFLDPPRPDTKVTIERAMEQGVQVKMITGDHSAIAKETCRTLGLGTNIQKADQLPAFNANQEVPQTLGQDYGEMIEQADGFAQARAPAPCPCPAAATRRVAAPRPPAHDARRGWCWTP
jgi:tetratricopeptide (TPR) repeat protein